MLATIVLVLALMAPSQSTSRQVPFPKHIEPIEYPVIARLAHRQGTVVARVLLDSEGKVINVSAKGHPMLADAVQGWIKGWTFETNRETTTEVVVEFKLVGEARTPSIAHTLVTYDLPDKVTIVSQPPVCDHCKDSRNRSMVPAATVKNASVRSRAFR